MKLQPLREGKLGQFGDGSKYVILPALEVKHIEKGSVYTICKDMESGLLCVRLGDDKTDSN